MTGNNHALISDLIERLRCNAADYFPELGTAPVTVEIRGGGQRVLSSLYRFILRSGTSTRAVVVKLPVARADPLDSVRPRLKQAPEDRSKFQCEHAALSAIHAYFTGLDDARFGSIRILDFVPEMSALVMEESRDRSLRDMLAGINRLLQPRAKTDVRDAVANTGAWLRSFHSMDALPGSRTRNDTREEFSATISRFFEYIKACRRGEQDVSNLLDQTLSAVRRHIPQVMPTAMGHGDFAPRNVLVGLATRVTVIDTIGVWRPAIYEDIGFFLTALRTSRIQAYSCGLAMSQRALAELENAFLYAYFGQDDIPYSIVYLFSIQSLLDKWCSHTERAGFPKARQGWRISSVKDKLIDANIKREIVRRLQMLSANASLQHVTKIERRAGVN